MKMQIKSLLMSAAIVATGFTFTAQAQQKAPANILVSIHNLEATRFWVSINDQHANPWDTQSGKAMTWKFQDVQKDLVRAGSDSITNPYQGDTSVDTALPILAIRKLNLTAPADVNPNDFYAGWSGGKVRLTVPVKGSAFHSKAEADAFVATQFGAGWQMAEFHDTSSGGGWSWWAYYSGNPLSFVANKSNRFWVSINDQNANGWNTTTGLAMTWKVQDVNNNLVRVGSDTLTNPYNGDTSVDTYLPILCIRKKNLPAPEGVDPKDFYAGWSGGEVRLTMPVKVSGFKSKQEADDFVAHVFGIEWQMAEFHDTSLGGWSWWAYNGY